MTSPPWKQTRLPHQASLAAVRRRGETQEDGRPEITPDWRLQPAALLLWRDRGAQLRWELSVLWRPADALLWAVQQRWLELGCSGEGRGYDQ